MRTTATSPRPLLPVSIARSARLVATASLALFAGAGCAGESTEPVDEGELSANRLFVAVEDSGQVAVLDGETGALVKTVSLAVSHGGETLDYAIHNVQGAPDGALVWGTALPAGAHEGGGHGTADQLVALDTASLALTTRIDLGTGLHPAHVVLSGQTAYVTAYETDQVLVVDLASKRVARKLDLAAGTKPHGARLVPDGSKLIVAGMGDKSLVEVNVTTGAVTRHELPGRAVQTAVLPDGSAAFASVYDTREIARLDLVTGAVKLFALPAGAAGPVQVYPEPDGSHLWIADQGLVGGEPAGDKVYRMDAMTGEVDLTATVSEGPHGIVVSHDGARAWVTTIVENTVESLDTVTGAVLSKTTLAPKPNGITCVSGHGSMP